jgi:hypothetical protein
MNMRLPLHLSPRIQVGLVVAVIALASMLLDAALAFPPAQEKDVADQFQELRDEAKLAKFPEERKRIAFEAVAAAELAVKGGDYLLANKLAILATDIAKELRNNHARTEAELMKKRVGQIGREFRKVKKYRKKLMNSPDDPQACYRYGRFVALFCDDWETALPLLAAGEDDAWRSAAMLELSGAKDNDSRVRISNVWLKLAEKERPREKLQLKLHAYDWIRLAWSNSDGAERKKLDAQLAESPIRYLNHMDEDEYVRGPWPLGKNGEIGNPEIGRFFVNKQAFPNGLGMHPPNSGFARLRYKLTSSYKTFNAGVALMDDSSIIASDITFWVLGDGKVLWKSAPFRKQGDVQYCSVNIRNVKRLEVRTHAAGSHIAAYAVWLDPYLSK